MSANGSECSSITAISSKGPKSENGILERTEAVIESVDATICGRLSCREANNLLRVKRKGASPRVVCQKHVGEYLSREVER